MQVHIREKGGVKLWFPLPTELVFNRFTAPIAARAASENGVEITPAQMQALFSAIKRYKRAHPDWVLAEVKSAGGDLVKVKL